jgi:hypothetical protein
MLLEAAAIFLIVFGTAGAIGLIVVYFLIRNITKEIGLDSLMERLGGLDTTIRSVDDFLFVSASMLDGIAMIFDDVGKLLPIVGGPFREIGRNLSTMIDNMRNLQKNIERLEPGMGKLEKITGRGIKISWLILVVFAWLIALHLAFIMMGIGFLYL